jgi:hypothetical protein
VLHSAPSGVPAHFNLSIMLESRSFTELDASELRGAYETLQSLQQTVVSQDNSGEGLQGTVLSKFLLVEILKLMEARLDGPQV